MSKNLANRLAITHIFTHSWSKITCVKNTENLSNKCISELKLENVTLSFFKSNKPWRHYPSKSLAGSEYQGHDVRFFNMDDNAKAEEFSNRLSSQGIHAELRGIHKNKPSVLVDLGDINQQTGIRHQKMK